MEPPRAISFVNLHTMGLSRVIFRRIERGPGEFTSCGPPSSAPDANIHIYSAASRPRRYSAYAACRRLRALRSMNISDLYVNLRIK